MALGDDLLRFRIVHPFGDPKSDKQALAGTSKQPDLPAVQGEHFGTGARGFLAGIDPVFHQQAGVYGESPQQGVMGLATQNAGTGVYGGGDNAPGSIGVRGETFTGVGVQGRSFGSGLAGKFIGDVEVTGELFLAPQDLSEDFDVTEGEVIQAGTVLVLDDEGRLTACRHAYDTRVIGVVAGASEYRPAIVLGRRRAVNRHRLPVALVGKVFCRADARKVRIRVGDLLTTSGEIAITWLIIANCYSVVLYGIYPPGFYSI